MDFLGARRVNDAVFVGPVEGRHRTAIAVLSGDRMLILTTGKRPMPAPSGPPPLAEALPEIATSVAAAL